MVYSSNNNSHPTCFLCGSQLIFVSKETVRLDGSRYPQTNTVYRCSNTACQEKKDKEKADRQKLQQTKAIADKERMEKIQEKRRLNREVKSLQD